MRSAYLALPLLLACSQGDSPPRGGDERRGGEGPDQAGLDPRCASVRPRVQSLYQKARDPSVTDQALADDLLAANVTMVMNDCRADPARVAPCAERVADAAELERTCLIPLDDEGAVDGDRIIKSK